MRDGKRAVRAPSRIKSAGEEQKSKILTIVRQGMRYSIVSTDSFTMGTGVSGKSSKKDGGSGPMNQILRPMESSLEAMLQEPSQLSGPEDMFFDMNLCFNAASVLKYICRTNSSREHSQLIQLGVVPTMMRILSVIRDFLPRFQEYRKNFEYTVPSFCFDPQVPGVLTKKVFWLLPYTACARLFREICGSISNCCQCLSNLQSDTYQTTNCIPLIQLLSFERGDGLSPLRV